MDELKVSGLRADVFIGAEEEERSRRQRLVLDLILYVDIGKAVRSDEVTDTVDYKKVSDAVLVLLEKGEFKLIEKAAFDTAACCLSFPGVKETVVTVRKPGALENADYASCTVRLAREND